jgi:hypothetical protein
MANPEQFKSISIDVETYNLLTTVAEAECRSVGGQIRWMIKNGMVNPTSPNVVAPSPAIPVAIPPMKRKSKVAGKIYTTGATADVLVKFFQTNATLCSQDFPELRGVIEDVSKTLYHLMSRGDLARVGDTKPYLYHITQQGIAKAKEILERR